MRGASPCPAPLTRSPAALRERGRKHARANVPRRAEAEAGRGRKEGSGGSAVPGSRRERVPPSRPRPGGRTSPAERARPPDRNLQPGPRKGSPARLPLPTPSPLRVPARGRAAPAGGARARPSRRLRLSPRWGRRGPAKGGVGETTGQAGGGGRQAATRGAGPTNPSQVSCPL